ncbi:MAG: amino acid adenylation domain-containing protein [Firmicutes bacterium]|jgi:amino acid adenylation domain-containing protein|nr:amino acid adenylation domain-containing protein [Bacillota bacterium]
MKTNMIQYFQETISNYAERIALVHGEERISFQELDRKCRNFAKAILEKNVDIINRPIAIYLPKSISCIIADIGTIYSGNAYMNLDVKTPETRIRNIAEQIKPAYVITDQSRKADFLKSDYEVLYIEDLLLEKEERDTVLLERLSRAIDTDPLCVINTSGSTGIPKGVVLNHRSFKDYTEWAIRAVDFGEHAIVGSLSPIVFDHFSFEVCLLMVKGVTLVILEESMSAFPIKLLEQMKKENVTFIFWVPTIMVNIANMNLLEKIELPTLKMVWFAGEVFPTRQFNYWRNHLPDVKFVNLYGPAECTVDCIYYIVERELSDDEPIPIGFPCRNTDILLLKEDNSLAAQGEEGEICVRGTSLAMGYYRSPEKTAAAFVQNPLNDAYPELIYRTGDIAYMNDRGEYVFKGRKDTLIKHMGYRIELSELEHIAGFALEEIQNCCVLYHAETKEIVLVYESQEELKPAAVRKELAQHCPKYMIPVKYIRMESLPMNTNGKVDRLKVQNLIWEEGR